MSVEIKKVIHEAISEIESQQRSSILEDGSILDKTKEAIDKSKEYISDLPHKHPLATGAAAGALAAGLGALALRKILKRKGGSKKRTKK